jgi:hypothetical protein
MTASTAMSGEAMSAAAVVGALLFRSGLEKVINLAPTVSTVFALGIPAKCTDRIAPLVALSEVAIAFGVLFAPHSLWTQAGVAALGGAFALAGLTAIIRKKRIRCNCFGSGGAGAYLGYPQILALPAWVGSALILHYGATGPPSLATNAFLFAAVGMTITALKAVALWRAVGDARADRISAQEMYIWLPSR